MEICCDLRKICVTGVDEAVLQLPPGGVGRGRLRRADWDLWLEAYEKEYQGFVKHGTLKIEQGAKFLGTTTRTEYKVVKSI